MVVLVWWYLAGVRWKRREGRVELTGCLTLVLNTRVGFILFWAFGLGFGKNKGVGWIRMYLDLVWFMEIITQGPNL